MYAHRQRIACTRVSALTPPTSICTHFRTGVIAQTLGLLILLSISLFLAPPTRRRAYNIAPGNETTYMRGDVSHAQSYYIERTRRYGRNFYALYMGATIYLAQGRDGYWFIAVTLLRSYKCTVLEIFSFCNVYIIIILWNIRAIPTYRLNQLYDS